ncbi:PIN domain-containing protein [Blautia obeum]|uniref:PIN domain-containing protein n=2 Tax=Blautia obeum TaxID=40520 RepID=UPI003566D30D
MLKGWKSMRVLIDTNVILDVLLKRSPFYEAAIEVLKLSVREDIQEFVSASAITDIYYIAYKNMRDKAVVRELLKKLLLIVSVAGVSEEEIQKALELGWKDFEDSVQYSVALLNEMNGLITRNVKDYSSSEIQVWEPNQFLELVQ